MSDWPTLLPSILFMTAIIGAPGCLVLVSIGIHRAKAFLGAPLITLAIVGIATLLSARYAWNAGPVILVTGMVCILALGIRSAAQRQRLSVLFKAQFNLLKTNAKCIGPTKVAWFAGSVVATAAIVFCMTAFSVPDTNHFSQNYDAAFHMSVIRRILETGCASPIGAGSVMGPADAIYPDAWHALAALATSLFGISLPQGIWVVMLTLLMFVLPCSSCLLVSTLFKFKRGFSFLFAAALPVVSSSSAASYVTFGPLYANLCGTALLPAAIAYVILAFDKTGAERVKAVILSLLTGVLGLGFTHPNTVFTLTLFLLPLFIARSDKWWQRVSITGFFVLCWTTCLNIAMFARTVNCLDRVPEDVERAEAFARFIGIAYDSLSTFEWLPITLCACIVAAGSIAAILTSKRWTSSWYLVGLSMLASLAICALFPTNWFSRIATGFWYRDYYRLDIMFRMFAFIALAGTPEIFLSAAQHTKPSHGDHVDQTRTAFRVLQTAGALACTAALCAIAVIGIRSHSADFSDATNPSDSAGSDKPFALTERRASFCEQVASVVGDSTILNNHNDASVWLYPIYGANALAKGLPANQMGDMDKDYQLLITSIDRYGANDEEGEKIRDAAKRLGVEYVTQMGLAPDSISEFDADYAIGYTNYEAENRITEETPGFELALEEESMRLWKLQS